MQPQTIAKPNLTTNDNLRMGSAPLKRSAVNRSEDARSCRRSPAGLQVKERDLAGAAYGLGSAPVRASNEENVTSKNYQP